MPNSHLDSPHLADIDEIDRQLLRVLQTQARMSITELAERVNLSATPCARRIKRSIFIDQTSIHFMSDAELEKLKAF